MPAAATDKFIKVGQPGTATTLSAPGYTIGGTSITVGSTSNWPTDTGVVFAIDQAQVVNGVEVQVPGTYNEYQGTVASGTSVANVSWKVGTGDRNYSPGALTRVYIPVSAERENRLIDGILTSLTQTGTLKPNVVTSSNIVDGTITASDMDTATNVETRLSESLGDFVASGLVWSSVSGLNGSMTAGVVYIGGKRIPVGAIASRAFTASKDTYVSVDNTGAVSYSEVANNAASPSLPANSLWLAKVVTGASTISSIQTSNFDSNGKPIYPRSLRTLATAMTTDANGWTVAFNSSGRKVYTKKMTQAVSLPNGISYNNYAISSTPVDVGSNLANYNTNFTAVLPIGFRHVVTNFMSTGTSIELGVDNLYTGGTVSTTVSITLMISEV